MKKKLLMTVLAVASAVCLSLGIAGCNKKGGGTADSGGDGQWSEDRLYEEAKDHGFEGTLEELIALFKGENGKDGKDGTDGKSAYDIWKENGHSGTESDFLNWLRESGGAEGTVGLHYTLNSDRSSYTLRDLGTAEDCDIVIPDLHNGLPVTKIFDNAFKDQSWITSISIGDKVTSIGEYAFSDCSGLTGELKIPDSVTSIGDYAFEGCSGLTSVTIGKSVTSIGVMAFWGCSGLTGELKIPDGITSIWGTFSGCSELTSITIPSSVTAIGDYAFGGCSGLTNITVPDSVTSIGIGAFQGCSGLTGELKIPDSVTSIEDSAFYQCSGLTSVTIGKSVTSIGGSAFRGCYKLIEIWNYSDLPLSIGSSDYGYVAQYAKGIYTKDTPSKKIKTDDGYLFYENGEEVYLLGYVGEDTDLTFPTVSPNGENYAINDYAFYGCEGLTSVIIPDSVTSIGSYAFYGCSGLTSVIIPNSVTSTGSSAFGRCYKLIEIWNYSNLPLSIGSSEYGYVAFNAKIIYTDNTPSKQVKTDDGYLFYEDGEDVCLFGYTGEDTELTLPTASPSGKNYAIYDYAFYYCTELTSITIPGSVTSIGYDAFRGCSGLTSVTIPDSVTSIGYDAFRDCSGLTSVTIGKGVTSIGERAFYYCDRLTDVTFANPNNWSAGATELKSEILQNSGLAALCLRETYYNFTWTRK